MKAADNREIPLRQNYNRCSKTLLKRNSGYVHARQYRRAGSCHRKLRTFLGIVIRDTERNATEMDQELKDLRRYADGSMRRRGMISRENNLTQHHGMSRNPLKGNEGDGINALLSAAGMNFSKLKAQHGKILRLFWDAIRECQVFCINS